MSLTNSPPPRRHILQPTSPRQTIRQEAFRQPHDRTLPTSRAEIKARGGHKPTLNPVSAARTSSPGSGTLTDTMPDHDDSEDPHDLALPTKHIARASMVDNLVMSLDQFSPAGPASRRPDRKESNVSRKHAASQPTTSDVDIRPVPTSRPQTSVRTAKLDSFKHQTAADELASIFGDEEDSHRAKAYAAQRAVQPAAVKPKLQQHRPSARSRSSSNSSSVDLGHLATFAGRLGPAGSRRSQSFDFGSSQRKKPIMSSETSSPASVPVISSDLDSSKNSIKASSNSQTVVRRNSGRSAKSAPGKKGRSGTIGASTTRPKPESPQPLPINRNLNFDIADRRNTVESPSEPLSVPRPGFFRRVFGSSRNTGAVSSIATTHPTPSQDRAPSVAEIVRPDSPARLQKQIVKHTADNSSNKENQPVVTKKPSSFFRRRKKSISTNVPPPLPLTLDSALHTTKVERDAPSPVSSLRAFMDPYLADAAQQTPGPHQRKSSLQSVQNMEDLMATNDVNKQTPENAVEDENKEVSTPRHTRKKSLQPSKLQIPSNNTFVVNNIKIDDNLKKNDDVSPLSATSFKPSISDRAVSPISSKEETGSQIQKTPTRITVKSRTMGPVRSESANSAANTPPAPQRRQTNHSTTSVGVTPSVAESELSVYKSAPSTPLVAEMPSRKSKSPHVHVSHPSDSQTIEDDECRKARNIFDNPDEMIAGNAASAWLGEGGVDRERVRKAYMELFDWTGRNILASLRSLCSKLALKGETQQVDRVLDTFANRWCECNNNHGFRSPDVVHTICYSILLLNTDLHLADIGQKMTRTQFIRNAILPIKQAASDPDQTLPQPNFLTVRSGTSSSASLRPSIERDMRSPSALSNRPIDKLSREDSGDVETLTGLGGPLVEAPYAGSQGGWEIQIEIVLKDFYTSISRDPLPLFGQPLRLASHPSSNSMLGISGLRRTPSTLSKARSETRGRDGYGLESKSLGARWASKTRSRPRLGSTQGYGSSRTSLDDGSSAWSPMSSTWSKTSLGKTLTSMSVDSFGVEQSSAGYQSSIGFANALSQAIIRDEQMDMQHEEGIKAAPLLEDESLELHGAPWAKEGILKHKCHLEGVDKRSKDRNWNDCFAVIEKGWMRLFSFSMTAKSLRQKAKTQRSGTAVGGGNWQDNAEEIWKFMLRHTIASSLPPPGYSKQRPYVWALSLPNGAVHLFSVGTPDIVKEFVSTANFWSARLSKEPMTGGISSMEYGWSDAVINRGLIHSESQSVVGVGSPRPSTQMSMRSSIDHGTGFRSKFPGDKIHVSDWHPPQQSLLPSQLMEVDQLKALQSYVKTIEDELQRHNELRGPMLLAFSARLPNNSKAMNNWEKKSSYLLREIVKFGTYIDALTSAQKTKAKVYRMRKEDEDARRDEKAERAFRRANEEVD